MRHSIGKVPQQLPRPKVELLKNVNQKQESNQNNSEYFCKISWAKKTQRVEVTGYSVYIKIYNSDVPPSTSQNQPSNQPSDDSSCFEIYHGPEKQFDYFNLSPGFKYFPPFFFIEKKTTKNADKRYGVKVRGENKVGAGDWSEESQFVVPGKINKENREKHAASATGNENTKRKGKNRKKKKTANKNGGGGNLTSVSASVNQKTEEGEKREGSEKNERKSTVNFKEEEKKLENEFLAILQNKTQKIENLRTFSNKIKNSPIFTNGQAAEIQEKFINKISQEIEKENQKQKEWKILVDILESSNEISKLENSMSRCFEFSFSELADKFKEKIGKIKNQENILEKLKRAEENCEIAQLEKYIEEAKKAGVTIHHFKKALRQLKKLDVIKQQLIAALRSNSISKLENAISTASRWENSSHLHSEFLLCKEKLNELLHAPSPSFSPAPSPPKPANPSNPVPAPSNPSPLLPNSVSSPFSLPNPLGVTANSLSGGPNPLSGFSGPSTSPNGPSNPLTSPSNPLSTPSHSPSLSSIHSTSPTPPPISLDNFNCFPNTHFLNPQYSPSSVSSSFNSGSPSSPSISPSSLPTSSSLFTSPSIPLSNPTLPMLRNSFLNNSQTHPHSHSQLHSSNPPSTLNNSFNSVPQSHPASNSYLNSLSQTQSHSFHSFIQNSIDSPLSGSLNQPQHQFTSSLGYSGSNKAIPNESHPREHFLYSTLMGYPSPNNQTNSQQSTHSTPPGGFFNQTQSASAAAAANPVIENLRLKLIEFCTNPNLIGNGIFFILQQANQFSVYLFNEILAAEAMISSLQRMPSSPFSSPSSSFPSPASAPTYQPVCAPFFLLFFFIFFNLFLMSHFFIWFNFPFKIDLILNNLFICIYTKICFFYCKQGGNMYNNNRGQEEENIECLLLSRFGDHVKIDKSPGTNQYASQPPGLSNHLSAFSSANTPTNSHTPSSNSQLNSTTQFLRPYYDS